MRKLELRTVTLLFHIFQCRLVYATSDLGMSKLDPGVSTTTVFTYFTEKYIIGFIQSLYLQNILYGGLYL